MGLSDSAFSLCSLCLCGEKPCLTRAEFAEDRAAALFCEAGLAFAFLCLTFQALQRGQKPRCIRLAKYHGEFSFSITTAQAGKSIVARRQPTPMSLHYLMPSPGCRVKH
jgi:hypothetical protein